MTKATHKVAALQFSYIHWEEQQTSNCIHWQILLQILNQYPVFIFETVWTWRHHGIICNSNNPQRMESGECAPPALSSEHTGRKNNKSQWVVRLLLCGCVTLRLHLHGCLHFCLHVWACLFYINYVCACTGLVPMCPPTQAALWFLVRDLSPSHLVVMETGAAAGTALAWVLYVSPIEHGMLNRALFSRSYYSICRFLHLAKNEKCFCTWVPLYWVECLPDLYRSENTKGLANICAYKFTPAMLFACIFQPFVSKIWFF